MELLNPYVLQDMHKALHKPEQCSGLKKNGGGTDEKPYPVGRDCSGGGLSSIEHRNVNQVMSGLVTNISSGLLILNEIYIHSLLGLVAHRCLTAANLWLDDKLVPQTHDYGLPLTIPFKSNSHNLKDVSWPCSRDRYRHLYTYGHESANAMATKGSVNVAPESLKLATRRTKIDILETSGSLVLGYSSNDVQLPYSVKWGSHFLNEGGNLNVPAAVCDNGKRPATPEASSSSTAVVYPKSKKPKSDSNLTFQKMPPNDAAKDGASSSVSSTVMELINACQRIPIYERNKGEDKKTAEVDITACRGYYSFAMEVRRQCPYDLGDHSLPHILWPWAPRYYMTDYFSTFNGRETEMDPLEVSWDVFSQTLKYVVVYPDLGDEELIALTVHRGTKLLCNLRFSRFAVCESYQLLRRVLYFYYQASRGLEPGDWDDMPDEMWPQAQCWYCDAEDRLLSFPGDNAPNYGKYWEHCIAVKLGACLNEASGNFEEDWYRFIEKLALMEVQE